MSPRAVPLCVNLDRTLVRNDPRAEWILAIVGNPRRWSDALKRRVRGRGKDEVAAGFDPALLAYNEPLITYLRLQRQQGRALVLVTEDDSGLGHAVARHVGLFDEVIVVPSRGRSAVEARAKALVERFGRGDFAYAGSDGSDLPIWKAAHSVVVVNSSRATRDSARKQALVEAEIGDRPSVVRSAWRAMRPHQWVKNLLVFVPMIMARAIWQFDSWTNAFFMFCAFCATASCIYIINDMSDLAADRRHPRKRLRPFASGALPLSYGLVLALVLLLVGMAFSLATGTLPIIVVYAIASIGYSLALKEFPLVDVFILAGLYTIRIIGGGLATGNAASMWLLAFSGFLFLSLALLKRIQELVAGPRSSVELGPTRRGYRRGDETILQIFGCASAFASSVVLALFVGSTAASAQYRYPELLWCVVPVILFWQCRLWLSTARGYMVDDPIVYATRDWVSWTAGACVLVVLAAAAYGLGSMAWLLGRQ